LQTRAVTVVAILLLILLMIVLAFQLWKYLRAPLPEPWARLGGPFDGRINALVIEAPDGEHMIYAGTDGGVFKSADQGKHWTACNNGLTSRLVRALAIDPDNPYTLYAGTWDGNVYSTADGGNSWQERSTGLPPLEIRALAVHTHDPRKLYAGMQAGVFTTTDAGGDWHPAGQFTGTLRCMVMEPEHPDILYVGTADHGIYKSFDGGATWISLRTGFSGVSSLVVPPRTTRTVYAISGGKIYRTENAGLTWSYLDYWRDPSVARSLAVDPKNPQEVYVGLQDGLYRSEDARQTWIRSDAGLKGRDLQVLAVDPLQTNIVYACTDNHFFISKDAGRTWERRRSIEPNVGIRVLALEADPKNGSVFYASVAGGGLHRTADGGAHWQHVGESLPAAHITAVEVDPVTTQNVYVGTREGFVFRSTSGGATWVSGSRVAEAPVYALAVDPEERERIYAGTLGEGLFRSDDAGLLWAYKGDDIGKDVQRIVIEPRGPQTTIYALTEEGVFRSSNAGENWQFYLSGVADIAPAVKGGFTRIPGASTVTNVFAPVVMPFADLRPMAGPGGSESPFLPPASADPGVEHNGLTTGPAMPGALYVMGAGEGVFRSTDLATNWTALGTGLESRDLQALALSPDDPNLILVGTDQGIYCYQPNKSLWQQLKEKLRR
jgi:photosystem II stability/assembly factor-like uncharacterized protein